MRKILSLFFSFFLIISQLNSQILPAEGGMLNYRLIGFSFPSAKDCSECKLEIAIGNHNSENSFKKDIIKTYSAKGNRIIAEVPLWGQQYTWRIKGSAIVSDTFEKNFYHFGTIINPAIDTSNARLRITQNAKKYKDAYVFLDNNKALYDMDGQAVWFLPGKMFSDVEVRDLKITPFGTITLMLKDKEQIYEINYEGDILWQGPNTGAVGGGPSEHYHHEFTRLTNGHYMVLGNEMPWEKHDVKKGSTTDSNVYHTNEPLPTIIEYDKNGKVIWSWASSAYFSSSDLINFNTKFFTQKDPVPVDVHANSFYFDEKAKAIYISCKDISRIIKLRYPEGTVLAVYGELFKRGVPEQWNGLFCNQHCIRHSPNGYIYLYNNNLCDATSFAKVIEMEEPANGSTKPRKIWEYECKIDGNYTKKELAGGGGCVMELPDNSLFVSMGGTYCKVFIVSKNKEILWSAIPEQWNLNEKKWSTAPQYRSSIITDRKSLEKLVWNIRRR